MIRSKKLTDGNLYKKLRKLAIQFNLAFSDCDLFGDIFFGLDLKRRKLLIADGIGNINWRYTIALADLKTIVVKKIYKSIRAGELGIRTVADFIHLIQVRLEFRDRRESIVLPIYGNKGTKIRSIQKMERRLARWYKMISQMISGEAGCKQPWVDEKIRK
jgi:hypothetical protein